MQKELDLDSSSKPKVTLSDLSEHDCPCPQDYLDVSVELLLYKCLHANQFHRFIVSAAHSSLLGLPAYFSSHI